MLEPLAGGVGSASRPLSDVWHGIADYGEVKSENERLRDQVAQLQAGQVDQENARDQLDTILAQQQIQTTGVLPRKLARVVSGPASNFENTIRIDQGAEAGIAVGMTVVTDAGLVGRVREVTTTRSVVELADSRGFAVGVRLVGGNAQATFLARGQAPGRPSRSRAASTPPSARRTAPRSSPAVSTGRCTRPTSWWAGSAAPVGGRGPPTPRR